MTVSTNLTTLHDCDADAGFTELPAPHSGGAAPALDEENYIQNNTLPASVSQATSVADLQEAGFQYTNGTTFTLGNANDVFLVWSYYSAPTNLYPWASGGLRLGIGTEDNLYLYNAGGNNFGNYPYGGWQNTAIDPDLTADQNIGTPAGATFDSVCILPYVYNSVSKGNPTAMDVIRYGRGDIVVTGTETFTSMAAANDAVAARWGLFQSKGGSDYSSKGLVSLGTDATSVSITDSNKSIKIEDTPRVSAGFNKIELRNAASVLDWTAITISGVATSITGSAPVSPGDFEIVNCSSALLKNCTFSDLGTLKFHANATVTSGTARNCQTITQLGATFTSYKIDKSESATAFIADDIDLVTGCEFISTATTGYHAVDLGTISANTTVSWNNTLTSIGTEWDGVSGTTVGVSGTANDAIVVSVDTGITLTINVDGGTIPNVQNTGLGTIIIQSSVPISVTVYKEDGVTVLSGASVFIKLITGDGGTVILNGITNASGILSGSYGGATPVSVDSVVSAVRSGSNEVPYQDYVLGGQIDSSGYSATAIMQED